MLRIKRCKTNQKEEKTMSELRDELLQETTGGCPEERTVLGGMPKINPDEKSSEQRQKRNLQKTGRHWIFWLCFRMAE